MKRDVLQISVAAAIAERTLALRKQDVPPYALAAFDAGKRGVILACADAVIDKLLSLGVLKGVK